jgi:hypothetical protein
MNIARTSRLLAWAGVIVFCAFVGDMIADSIADAYGDHCISQTSQSGSQHEKTPCSHCSCCVHSGSAIVSSSAPQISGALQPSVFVPALERSAPDGIAASIDHPPQLA